VVADVEVELQGLGIKDGNFVAIFVQEFSPGRRRVEAADTSSITPYQAD
jgi:hypothetical protein